MTSWSKRDFFLSENTDSTGKVKRKSRTLAGFTGDNTRTVSPQRFSCIERSSSEMYQGREMSVSVSDDTPSPRTVPTATEIEPSPSPATGVDPHPRSAVVEDTTASVDLQLLRAKNVDATASVDLQSLLAKNVDTLVGFEMVDIKPSSADRPLLRNSTDLQALLTQNMYTFNESLETWIRMIESQVRELNTKFCMLCNNSERVHQQIVSEVSRCLSNCEKSAGCSSDTTGGPRATLRKVTKSSL